MSQAIGIGAMLNVLTGDPGGLRRLLGKTVRGVRLNPDKTILSVECDEGVENFFTEGDCCSNSWIEHISGLDVLIGHRVNDGTIHETQQIWDDPVHQDELTQIYKWTLETTGGRCDIEMRNSSNGYYGGWLEKYEGVLPESMPLLTEDF